MGIHNEFIHKNFNDKSEGLDLPYCDIKTTSSIQNYKFALKLKDNEAKWFIFYSHIENRFYFCINEFNRQLRKSTTVRLTEIKNKAIFSTDSIIEIKLFYYLKAIEI